MGRFRLTSCGGERSRSRGTRLIFAAGRTPTPFRCQVRHPIWRSPRPAGPTACQTFKAENSLFDLFPFCLQFGKYFTNVHQNLPPYRLPLRLRRYQNHAGNTAPIPAYTNKSLPEFFGYARINYNLVREIDQIGVPGRAERTSRESLREAPLSLPIVVKRHPESHQSEANGGLAWSLLSR